MTEIDLPEAPSGVPLAVRWDGTTLRLLDQRLLPREVRHDAYGSGEEVFAAIREMRVRGAPAIGIAAAFGLALALKDDDHLAGTGWLERLDERAAWLITARPTAVNLAWAVHRCCG
ncbi:MAG: hypothetical protein V2J24_11750, partial [Pseudomonadales bacterium]|nr:hypothetical protein [Pseudomonadales bacterium]